METINNKKNNKFKKIFIEPTEEFVTSLGKTYIQSYLTNGEVSKGFAVVSNKRVYFKGSCYEREGKKFYKKNEERIVDLDDITGTGDTTIKSKWMLYISVAIMTLFVIVPLFFTIVSEPYFNISFFMSSSIMLSPLFLFSIGFAIVYKIKSRNLFEISFAGGKICFDTKWYDKEEIDRFQRKIRLAKDNAIKVKQPITSMANNKESSMNDILDGLKRNADLLKEGVITQAEYDNIKSNLLKQ